MPPACSRDLEDATNFDTDILLQPGSTDCFMMDLFPALLCALASCLEENCPCA